MNAKLHSADKIKWAAVLALVVLHPFLLLLLYPFVGERCNLVIVIAPLAATWLLGRWAGFFAIIANVAITGFFFATRTSSGPAEGIPKSLVSIIVLGLMCFGLYRLKRYIEKGRTIADELHRMRNSHRM